MFHIGYHKTATSWLQDQLFVSGHPVFQPLSTKEKEQSTFAKYFVMDKDGYVLHPLEKNTEFLVQEFNRLQSSIPQTEQKYLVVSQERLSGNPHGGGTDASLIAERIYDFAPSAKIFMVIREQTSWLLSNYFQYLSIGGTRSLEQYINQTYSKRPYFSYKHVLYHHLIKKYHSLFGKENVCVLPYELFQNKPEEFFSHFSSFLGKDIQIQEDQLLKKVNAAKPYYGSYHLRYLNWMIDKSSINNFSILSNRLTRPFAKNVLRFTNNIVPQSRNDRLYQQLRQSVLDWSGSRYQQSNQITQELIGIDLKRLSYLT